MNSWAHITFNVWESDEGTLGLWEDYTEQFAAIQYPVSLRFSRTGTFDRGVYSPFFLAPDKNSEQALIEMMKAFHQKAPYPVYQSVKPHISIGRRLNPSQLATAQAVISEPDIRFVCSDLVLRQFNQKRGQYDICRRFPFAA